MTSIRRYLAGDHDQVVDLVLPIQQEEFGIAITYEEQPDLVDPEAFFTAFWVAVEGEAGEAGDAGDVVGTIGLLDVGEGTGVVRKMFVRPDQRGTGTARDLLDGLIDEARQRGLTELLLGTTSAYHAAHRFYEKHGFRRVEPDDLPERFPRVSVDSRFYRLDLRPPEAGATWRLGPGVVELPDGRRVRGRGLRRPLPPGSPEPELGVYLLGHDPGPMRWPHLWVRWPDMRTPSSGTEALAVLREAWRRSEAERVELACTGGIGRTGCGIAILAALSGVAPEEAVAWVRRHYDRRAVETPWQARWVLGAARRA